MIKTILISFLIFSGFTGFAKSPNIVFIMSDDLGPFDLGYSGHDYHETPHIDALAASGMIFEQAYSSGANCAPSRACFMTGMYTPRHKSYQPNGKSKGQLEYMKLATPNKSSDEKIFDQFENMETNRISPEWTSLAEILKPRGYVTARLGKWHLGDTQGFDLSSGCGTSKNRKRCYGDPDVHETLTDAALSFMEEHQDGPFFLFLSHWDVHSPIKARKEVIEKYTQKLTSGTFRERYNPTYAGMVEAVDVSVGRVVAKIHELGIAEDTLIIFTSDNGGIPKYNQGNLPLRGGKGCLFEGGIRIPLVASWAGTIESGTINTTPTANVDFMPTFAELAGAALPTTQPVDGQSIVPALHGGTLEDRPLYWYYPMYLKGSRGDTEIPVFETDRLYWRATPSCAMRVGSWKILHFFEGDTYSVYNLDDDPSEQKDLITSHPEKAADLKKQIDALTAKTKAPLLTVENPYFDSAASLSGNWKPKKETSKQKK